MRPTECTLKDCRMQRNAGVGTFTRPSFFIAKLGPNTPSLATIKSILSFVDTPLLAAGWFINRFYFPVIGV